VRLSKRATSRDQPSLCAEMLHNWFPRYRWPHGENSFVDPPWRWHWTRDR